MKLKRTLAAAAIGVVLAVIPVTSAMALTSESAGGGLFQYGVEGGKVLSNYHHGSKYHTATACSNAIVSPCTQVAAAPGSWARASTTASWLGGNKSWWNTL